MTCRVVTAAAALVFTLSGIVFASSAVQAQVGPVPASDGVSVSGEQSSGAPGSQIILRAIEVQGNQRIEADTVRAYMALKQGEPFDVSRMDASLKSLFATGLFADVAMARQGDVVLVRVVENPIVNRVAFEGNKRVNDEALTNEVQLRPRQVFTRTKVQEDVKRILDVYRRSGRYAVSVEPKIIEQEQNRIDLVFEVNEGDPTYIRRINFVGNQKFSDGALREAIVSREERWYRFFSAADTYDPDRLTYDRELLRRYYLKNGYSDFRVVSAVAELTPDRTGFFVTFTIDEGERYKFGKMDIQVGIPDVKSEDLVPYIVGETGDWYNADLVEDTVQGMTDVLGSLGYAFVDVRPRVRHDREGRVIDITYTIQEGPRVFVDRIDITGNVRTLDEVIRREILVTEGDAFNTAKLRRSRERIRNLGFFEQVEVTNVPSETAPDRTVIQVDVQEQSTGEMSFGVGFSTTGGALFDVRLRERNLLGRGQDLRLSGTVAQTKTEIDLSFTEPYFLNRRLAAGFDLYSTTRDLQEEASYDMKELGAAVRVGFSYNEFLRQSLSYSLTQTTISNVDNAASTFIKQREGKAVVSQISQALLYDRRDNIIMPREGYMVRLSNDFGGLGGDEVFLRTTVDASQFFPIGDESVFALSGTTGYIYGIGDDVRFYRNYNLGGDNLRGFTSGGASPRDAATDDVLGGVWVVAGTAEARFPVGLPAELGVTGKAFTDVGMIGTPDGVSGTAINSSTMPRASIGVGILWTSPMGPISIDLAQPILKQSFDESEVFRFNFGTRF